MYVGDSALMFLTWVPHQIRLLHVAVVQLADAVLQLSGLLNVAYAVVKVSLEPVNQCLQLSYLN